MAINYEMITQVRDKLVEEIPEEYSNLIDRYDEAINIPNYRAAFMVLMDVMQIKNWRPSNKLNELIGKFWHEVAE